MPVRRHGTAASSGSAAPPREPVPLGDLADRDRHLRLVLAADFGRDHLVFRLGCAAHRRRHLDPRDAADAGTTSTQLGKPIWDTLNIATLGTLIALVLAVPVAFLAARNTTPSALFIRPIALLIIVSTRSINSLIWALLLIAIIGPGVFAGVIAIAIRSIGFCAKLLYEAIEEIDDTQVEAITATGASRWQVMAYGIVPQILPAFAGIAVFRWDINIRELHRSGPGRRGRHRAATRLAQRAGLAAGLADPAGDPRRGAVSEWVSAKVRGAII